MIRAAQLGGKKIDHSLPQKSQMGVRAGDTERHDGNHPGVECPLSRLVTEAQQAGCHAQHGERSERSTREPA